MLTIEQQRKAVAYSIVYLTNEIADSKKSIRISVDEYVKKIHQDRLQELKKDLAIFEGLGDNIIKQFG